LGEYLVTKGLIRRDQMEHALARQQVGEHKSPDLVAPAHPALRDKLDRAFMENVATDV
jgi:hypothetical protein